MEMGPQIHSESSEKILHALLITQISKKDYGDFWTFSEITCSRQKLQQGISSSVLNSTLRM